MLARRFSTVNAGENGREKPRSFNLGTFGRPARLRVLRVLRGAAQA
jgi:hypothetical protein